MRPSLRSITIIGEKLVLPLTGDAQATCPNTGKQYTLANGNCHSASTQS
ncbi:MAG: hypothetical protein WCI64_11910 [Chlorobium sp.]